MARRIIQQPGQQPSQQPRPQPGPAPQVLPPRQIESGFGREVAPTVGGIIGGAAGSVLGVPGAIAGGAIGAAGGEVVQQTLEDIKGTQKQTQRQQLQEAGLRAASGALSEFGGVVTGKVASKATAPLLEFLGKKLPAEINKLGLGITGKSIQQEVKKIGRQKASEQLGKTVERPAKEVAEKFTESGVVGTAKSIQQQSSAIIQDAGDAIRSTLSSVPKPDGKQVQSLLLEAMEGVSDQVTKASDEARLLNIVSDKFSKLSKDVQKDGWVALLESKQKSDQINKGKSVSEIVALERRFDIALADLVRRELRGISEVGEDIGKALDAQSTFLQIEDFAARKAAQQTITRGDIIPLVIGGTLGAVGGGAPGAVAGVAASKALFSPAVTSRTAQALTKFPAAARGVGSAARRVGSQGAAAAVTNRIRQPLEQQQLNERSR